MRGLRIEDFARYGHNQPQILHLNLLWPRAPHDVSLTMQIQLDKTNLWGSSIKTSLFGLIKYDISLAKMWYFHEIANNKLSCKTIHNLFFFLKEQQSPPSLHTLTCFIYIMKLHKYLPVWALKVNQTNNVCLLTA